MPNIAQVLKEEIRRLAKKEAKILTRKLRVDVVKLKKSNVVLRRSVQQLQRDNSLLLNAEKRRQQSAPLIAPERASKARVTAKGVRAMRRKLRLSQKEFAELLGVSSVAVCLWERKNGALRLRETTRSAILALRGLGAREAKRRLELVKPAAKKAARRRRKK